MAGYRVHAALASVRFGIDNLGLIMSCAGILKASKNLQRLCYVLLIHVAIMLASCNAIDGLAPSDFTRDDDPDVLGTIEGDPGNEVADNGNGPTREAPVADPQAERVGLIFDIAQRCAIVSESFKVVVTRQLAQGEEPSGSGELPNISGLVEFEQSLGTSLDMVSRDDESVDFVMGSQDIVGLTASIENGSVTAYLAGYDSALPPRFIMRKPTADGCLYAFKVDDNCATGYTKASELTLNRDGVSMSANGCELNNPDGLPVFEVTARAQ